MDLLDLSAVELLHFLQKRLHKFLRLLPVLTHELHVLSKGVHPPPHASPSLPPSLCRCWCWCCCWCWCWCCCCAYERGDCGVPSQRSYLLRIQAILHQETNVAARCKELFDDVRMSLMRRRVQRCVAILRLRIHVASCCKELPRHGRMPVFGRGKEGRAPEP